MKVPDWEDYQANEYYEVPQEIRKKYMHKTIVELLEILDSFTEREWIEEKKPHHSYIESSISADIEYKEYKALELEVLQRLELVKGYDMLRILYAQIEELETKIEELDKRFKNHRHPLDKTYGEKPIW